MSRVRRAVWAVLALFLVPAWLPAQAFDHAHAQWNDLLGRHVSWSADGHASVVDYPAFRRDRPLLTGYLDSLSAVTPAAFRRFDQAQQLAWLINAYNAFTIELILRADAQPATIRDLGSLFRSPWKQRFFELLGERRHLDDIEHGLIRGDPQLADPRIHFAVNCASVGCPALRPEAFVAGRLDAQLDDQTRRFLGDRSRNRIEGDTLWLSPIFDWYEEDFGRDAPPLDFLRGFAKAIADDAEQEAALLAGSLEIDHTDYDWSLNKAPP